MDSQTQLSELEFAVKDHLYGIDSYEIKSTKIAMDTGQNDDTRDTKSNDNHKGDRKASNSDHFYYIDIKLLEDRHIQVSVSASGFYVLPKDSNVVYYESLTALLHRYSPLFTEKFGQELTAKLNNLVK